MAGLRVLVVRLGALGDLVHAVPAVAAIRRTHPDAAIDWLVEPKHAEFLGLVPPVSEVVPLAGRSVSGWLATRADLRSRRYDVAIDLQGLVKSAALAWLSDARRVIGFDASALRERAAAWFYSERVRASESGHVIRKNLELVAALGVDAGAIEFPIRETPPAALEAIRASGVERFALINPGAGWPNKRWPPRRFGEVAASLRSRHGLRPVVLWGPGERPLAAQVVAESGGAAIEAPPTSVTDVVTLARASALMVSGDTGPLHIAAAVGTPVVAVFGPTDPVRNGPWRDEDLTVARYDGCSCHYARECRRTNPTDPCIERITAAEVLDAIDRRLARMP